MIAPFCRQLARAISARGQILEVARHRAPTSMTAL